jgi:predicted SprT family Zn-dependent metalloprotease
MKAPQHSTSLPQRQAGKRAAGKHLPTEPLLDYRENVNRGQREQDAALTAFTQRELLRLGLPLLAAKAYVRWNGRLQTTAGTACPYTGRVELNPLLRRISQSQIMRTLRHEIAHLVAHGRVGRKRIQSHGPEWRQACCDLGIPDEPAFHDLPFRRRTIQRRHAYQCPHCRVVVQRVHKFRGITACYACCKKYNGGKYDPQFRFQRVELPSRA